LLPKHGPRVEYYKYRQCLGLYHYMCVSPNEMMNNGNQHAGVNNSHVSKTFIWGKHVIGNCQVFEET
jgi:hypothetical protein